MMMMMMMNDDKMNCCVIDRHVVFICYNTSGWETLNPTVLSYGFVSLANTAFCFISSHALYCER